MLPRVSQVECVEANYLLFSNEDMISNTLFTTGVWEERVLKVAKFFLAELDAPLVLDIGANLGACSIPLAKQIAGTGGKVIGFEPQRIVYYQLCGNIVLNRLDNFYAMNAAVGEADGVVDIPEIDYQNNKNIGAFSIDARYRQHHGIDAAMKAGKHKVPLIALNTFEVEKPPALIKLDVEGFELNVLKGATDFLPNNGYPPIIFEAWPYSWFKEGREELLSFVTSLGYNITNISRGDCVAQHPKHPTGVAFEAADNNVIHMRRTKATINN